MRKARGPTASLATQSLGDTSGEFEVTAGGPPKYMYGARNDGHRQTVLVPGFLAEGAGESGIEAPVAESGVRRPKHRHPQAQHEICCTAEAHQSSQSPNLENAMQHSCTDWRRMTWRPMVNRQGLGLEALQQR